MRRSRRLAWLTVVMSLATVWLESAQAREDRTSTHHHCIHDDQLRRLEESIDVDSLTVPQVLLPLESSNEREVNDFLGLVGARRHLRVSGSESESGRSLATSASSSSFQPIRVAFEISKLTSDPGRMCTKEGEIVTVDGGDYTCRDSDVLTKDKAEFLVSVLLKAVEEYFESVLSVQRVVGNLIVSGLRCSMRDQWACCANTIPPSYKTDGVPDADYVLHVTARPTTGATIAWALPCNIDQFGRPISGHANFGPGRIDPVTPAARTEQIGTAIHEMTHAMVFSQSRFGDFRQPLNGDKWGYANVVSQTKTSGGIWVSKVVTPSVAREAKRHFNCFDWMDAGVELENGDAGSASFSSHWEKRMLMNEFMTATSSHDPVYSAMTLALFEDSGWYQVSYKNAQLLPWGYMEGCGFVQSKCSTWNSQYICSQASQTGCTADFASKGYCNVATYSSSIPAGFQYFQDPRFGGRDTYADYCPLIRGYSNGDCRNIGRVQTLANTNNFMEIVGPSSKCFQSSLSKTSSDTAALRSTCYKVMGCTSDYLRLSIDSKEVRCPMAGGELRVSGYRGKIMCPVANKLCQMIQDKCSGNGVLQANGACQCYPGFVGGDCAGISCPKSPANGEECGGSSHGTCSYTTGTCTCTAAYTGMSCSELVCPVAEGGKHSNECSNHGTCDRAFGTCRCTDGYSGKACECVPGCTATSCGSHGKCDCITGACTCSTGYSGVDCTVPSNAPITELTESSAPVVDTIVEKGYKFYRINLESSSYDITCVVTYENSDGSGADVDLYGSFIEQYPTSLSAKTTLFESNYGIGNRDEIHLCGSLGVFPRGLNDRFRYCARPTSSYVLETPGYFYLAVFGYSGGQFTLSIETDKCKKITCSNHGKCGVNYPGVCTCERYWSGDDCSIPKCGPDCVDLGTCNSTAPPSKLSDGDVARELNSASSSSAAMMISGSSSDSMDGEDVVVVDYATSSGGGLQSTSECYGNGVCTVGTDPITRLEVPRCVCDDAFSFAKPTPAQALCKELLPSVASVQRFTEPFTATTTTADQALKVSSWALFTIQVKDEWEVLVATLGIQSIESDTMLVVRKEKLPSVVLSASTSSSSSSFLQFMDSDGWTSGSTTRKVVLTRASSTLSSGLYYVGVYNSPYARAALSYSLTVNATSDCATPDTYGICAIGATCNAKASPICSCANGSVGKFCELQAKRAVLSPVLITSALPSTSPSSSASADADVVPPPVPASATSYVAFSSASLLLGIGEWSYFSFDINDPTVKLAQFRLVIDNDLRGTTPALPLLLVRGPSEDGFPTLFRESQQDFRSVSQRSSVQSVPISVDSACSFEATSKDCYKVAIHNRQFAGDTLRYHLEVVLYRSEAAIYPSASCATTGDEANCYGNGKCLLIAANDTPKATTMPTCKCSTGWTGLRCNSPKSFDLPQLWSAITNISLLCTTCSSSFTIGRGEVKMFRVPASLRENSGLRLRVRPVASSNSTVATSPNVYVSETLPRSLYDFNHISTASNGDRKSVDGQVVQLTNESFTGHFWVVVFSDYPVSDGVELTAGTRWRQRRLSMLHSQQALRVLAESTATTPTFTLEAEVYELPPDDGSPTLLTDKSFTSAVFEWLFKDPIGIGVFTFTVFFLVLIMCYCLWRICNAPENQDKATRRFFGDAVSQAHNPTGTTLRRPTAKNHVMDVERGRRSTRTTRHA